MTWKCPKCGSKDLRVVVTTVAKLTQHDDNFETEVEGDHEWSKSSWMVCNTLTVTQWNSVPTDHALHFLRPHP